MPRETTALLTDDDRLEQQLAVPMGAGIGLTFDEAALLLDLRDVYWMREGLLSVQLSLGAAAILSTAILTLRILRRGERRQEAEGLIPAGADRFPPRRYRRTRLSFLGAGDSRIPRRNPPEHSHPRRRYPARTTPPEVRQRRNGSVNSFCRDLHRRPHALALGVWFARNPRGHAASRRPPRSLN